MKRPDIEVIKQFAGVDNDVCDLVEWVYHVEAERDKLREALGGLLGAFDEMADYWGGTWHDHREQHEKAQDALKEKE